MVNIKLPISELKTLSARSNEVRKTSFDFEIDFIFIISELKFSISLLSYFSFSTFATKTEIGFTSIPKELRLFCLDANKVVPLPENGSKTLPVIFNSLMKAFTRRVEYPSRYGNHL